MKKLLATLAIAAFALPAQAGVLLPSIFAAEFCILRDRGVGLDAAMRAAAEGAYIDGKPKRVMFQGVEIDEDVMLSMLAVQDACPGHMR